MCILLALLCLLTAAPADAQELYLMPPGQTHWASPENPTGAKGAAGTENKGGKGHASDTIPPGGTQVLADITGSGIIDRIWLTIDKRSFEQLRATRLDIWWDGAKTPAVSVPLGDFFLQNAGEMRAMDTALFASAEGRSFVSYVPMPFHTAARITVTNETKDALVIYDDVDYRTLAVSADTLYFHAWWSRDRATTPGRAFEVLPAITGRGRFLGMSIDIQTNPLYGKNWWGEGEVRMFMDGETTPSLSGTGSEDYIGDAWGQTAFINRYQGAPVADDAAGRWSFYRFHIPDPVVFDKGLRVVWQQIGGAMKPDVIAMQKTGVPLVPVTINGNTHLLDAPRPLDDPSLPDGWTNFYRSDDVSAVAYFYLDSPESGLPASDRTADLRTPK